MPNRIIKESVCVSEQIDELNWFEEVFFYRLLVNCDDYGCMDAREKVLAAKLFPLKVVRPAEIMKALSRLAEIGLIGMYEVEGHPYLKVLKWSDHQRVRVSKHKYPEPTEEQLAAGCGESRQLAASCGELQRDAATCGLNPIQSNPNPYPNPNTNPNPNPTPTRAGAHETQPDDSFNRFWDEYPKKVAKQDAIKAWEKLRPDASLVTGIMNGLFKWKSSDEWKRNEGQFVPYPATWLNHRRWEDEVKAGSSVKPSAKTVAAQQYTQRDYSKVDEEAMALMLKMGGYA